tara:strand:+ start:3432 stop:5651 length:2220 start_codon:yes stop_codon:yes gene_type:complete
MLRRIHSFPGLIAAVLVAVLAISGAILSINPALERSEVDVPAPGHINVASLANTVQQQFHGVEAIIRKPSGAVVVYYFENNIYGADKIDPVTGAKMAEYDPSKFTRWVAKLHRSLFLDDAGRAAAGIGALSLLILTVSGLFMLAKRLGGWRHIFRRVRGTNTQRLHAIIGRLAVLGLLLSALTGTYMSLTTFEFVPHGLDAEPDFPYVVNEGAPMSVADIIPLQSVELSELRELTFPYVGDLTDVYSLTTNAGMGYIDQTTGEILTYLPHNAQRQIFELIYMLHTGEGLWSIGLLVGFSALSVPFMGYTGALVWWKRRCSMPRISHNIGPQRADTIILVGSESNSTWGFAKTLHLALHEAGHKVHIAPMNALKPAYHQAKHMFILTGTYGDGAAPASAKNFLAKLDAIKAVPKFTSTVLGFGDRQFPDFCAFAQDVDTALTAKNWQKCHALTLIDRQSAQSFTSWGAEIGAAMGIQLLLNHAVTRPRTTTFQLSSRIDYGQQVQAPTTVFNFKIPDGKSVGFWPSLRPSRLPKFEAGDLVGIFAPNNDVPRFYSLASSSTDGMLQICVRKHVAGVCSGFLHSLKAGDQIKVFIQPNPEFRPAKGKTPIILIGAGTGVGPLAGFIRANKTGRAMHLYFGGRNPGSDFLYQSDFLKWSNENKLSTITTAFSRVAERKYVQDRIIEDAELLCSMIECGAQILVCGGRSMADEVRETITLVIAPLGLDPATLKSQGRYLEDVY